MRSPPWSRAIPWSSAGFRITYTGGLSPLGSDRGDAGPTLVVAMGETSRRPDSTAVVTVPWTRNERGAVTGLKTTSYAENVIALARAHEGGASEALFPNTVGQLCEGTGSNVFVVLDGRIHTPPIASGCLAGITRALTVEWTGAQETDLPLDVLEAGRRDLPDLHAPGHPGRPPRRRARARKRPGAGDGQGHAGLRRARGGRPRSVTGPGPESAGAGGPESVKGVTARRPADRTP